MLGSRHLINLRVCLLATKRTIGIELLLHLGHISVLNWLLIDKLWLRHQHIGVHLMRHGLSWNKQWTISDSLSHILLASLILTNFKILQPGLALSVLHKYP